VHARTFIPKNSTWTKVKKQQHQRKAMTAVQEVKKIKNTNPKARPCHFHFDPRKTCRKGTKCRFSHSRKEQEDAEKKFNDFIARQMIKAEEKDKKKASKIAAMVAEMAKRIVDKIKKVISEQEMAKLDIITQPKKEEKIQKTKKMLKTGKPVVFHLFAEGKIDGLKAVQKEKNRKNWQEKEVMRKEMGIKKLKWSVFKRLKRKQKKTQKPEKKIEKKIEVVVVKKIQKIPTKQDFEVNSEVKVDLKKKEVKLNKWTEMAKKEKNIIEKEITEEEQKKQEMKESWEKDKQKRFTRFIAKYGSELEDEDEYYCGEIEEDDEEEYEGTDAW